MKRGSNRRQFLRNASVLGAGLCVAGVPAIVRGRGANEKLNVAVVGTTGRGAANTTPVAKTENIVALCDVDEQKMGKVAEKFPQAKRYIDWRKLFDDQKQFDAVIVSTTEHTHAPISVTAMRLGKHVYCEKPLAHSVEEARAMGETARKMKVATQMGTQIHATENYRRVVELIKTGAIGPVREAHVWCDRVPHEPRPRPTETMTPPAGFHWDLWLGPAPCRAYHKEYHASGCLGWDKRWDFGNGTLGDMGSHEIDLPFWALDLRYPLTAEAEGDPRENETYPRWLKARWEHPAKGKRPAVTVCWYDGGKRPPQPEGIDLTTWKIGCIFKGDKGTLVADYGRNILLPEAKFKDFQRPKPFIAKSLGHHEEWVHACKTGAPTLCNFDYSGALIEHNLLGCVAFRVGKKLQWDPVHLKATNCPEADRYLRKQYRKGWEWL
jgi:predicted dehydrogenase